LKESYPKTGEDEYSSKALLPKLKRSVRSKREERARLGEGENDKKKRRLRKARIHENQYYYVKNDTKGGYDRLPTNSILMGATADILMGNPNQFDLKTVLETSKPPADITSDESEDDTSKYLVKERIGGNLLCNRKTSRSRKLSAKREIEDEEPTMGERKKRLERTEEDIAEEDRMYKLLLTKIKKTTSIRNTSAKVLKAKVEGIMYDIIFNVENRRSMQCAYTIVALVNTREEIQDHLDQIQRTLDFQKSVMTSTKGHQSSSPHIPSPPKGKETPVKVTDKEYDGEDDSVLSSSSETIALQYPTLAEIDDLYGKYISENFISIIQHDKERMEKYCEMIYRVWKLLLCCENVLHDGKASSQFDKFALGFLYVLSEGDVSITNHRTEETIVLLKKDEWLKYALPSKTVLCDTHNNKFRKREVVEILSANSSFSWKSLQFSTRSKIYSSRSVSGCCERVRKMLSNYKWYAEDKALLQRYVSEFRTVQYIPLKRSSHGTRKGQ
jgi:hypothetical protein